MEQVIPNKPGRLTLGGLSGYFQCTKHWRDYSIAAGLGGCDVLGEQCHDPFWRQAIRFRWDGVSAADPSSRILSRICNAKKVSGNRAARVCCLKVRSHSPKARRAQRFGILFGNEAQGIDEQYVRASDRQITIPDESGDRFAECAIAAGIMLLSFYAGGFVCERLTNSCLEQSAPISRRFGGRKAL